MVHHYVYYTCVNIIMLQSFIGSQTLATKSHCRGEETVRGACRFRVMYWSTLTSSHAAITIECSWHA